MDFWVERAVADEAFASEFREWLEANYPDELKGHRFARPFDWGFHRKLTAWRKAHLEGATAAQLVAFRREAEDFGIEVGSLTPSHMVARVLEQVGTAEQQEFAQLLDDGDVRCSLGYTEPDSGSDVAAATTRAVRDGDAWIVNGQKMFTSHADVNTHVFLLTRTNTEVPKHKGLTMFLIPLDTPGIEVRPVETLGYHSTCMTFYSDVMVPDSARVGDVDAGWSVMRRALDVEHGAGPKKARPVHSESEQPAKLAPDMDRHEGTQGKLLGQAVKWARTAVLEDGTRPMDDPVVVERLARIAVENEVARLISKRNDPQRNAPGVGNGNKWFWTEAYVRATRDLLLLGGPAAVLPYTEPGAVADGWFEFGFRGAPVWTIAGGCSEVQLDVVAERRLGMPRARGK